MNQDTLAAELREALQRLEERLTAGVTPLTPAQRATRPPDGGWCVDEILEHLCLANADYLGAMEGAMERALGTGHTPRSQRRWRASLGGWLLVRAMESERRTRAPAAIVPATTPRDGVLDAVVQSFRRLRDAVELGATCDWRQLRMSSPYARWLRLNFGDAALVVVRHAERHARQLERTVRAL